ncbi:MAG TPA: gluconate 2-dehydrogenase subunit 3 family protein [Gemmatimonadales bacterium]
MHRRELLQVLGAAAAIPILRPLSPEARLDLARAVHARLPQQALRSLDAHQNALVTEMAELIIPATDTPGARDVRVNEFVDLVLTEWHTLEERDRFLAGLDLLDARCRERFGSDFLALAPGNRTAVLTELDGASGEPGTPETTFARLKQLTVVGYFTSERVMREILADPIIPGRFDGCIPVAPRGP